MCDDFCIIHGYEAMKSRFGDPIPYCEACENARELGIDPLGWVAGDLADDEPFRQSQQDTHK